MKDLTGNMLDTDYVERLIDQVVADPTRVDDVKTLLRHKMTGSEPLSVVSSEVPEAYSAMDVDDLWDNVPV